MGNEFKVLRIDELTRVGKTGAIEKYYRHQIETKGGVVCTVDISEANTTEQKAQPILLAKALEMDKIKAL